METEWLLLLQARHEWNVLSNVHNKVWHNCYFIKFLESKIQLQLFVCRCHALDFQMSKSQKKIMKKMAKFLDADQSIEALGKYTVIFTLIYY